MNQCWVVITMYTYESVLGCDPRLFTIVLFMFNSNGIMFLSLANILSEFELSWSQVALISELIQRVT